MDRRRFHAPGLYCTVNSVFRSAPRFPPAPTNCPGRCDQSDNAGRPPPTFSFGNLSPLPFNWTPMDRLGLRDRCHTPAATAPPGRPTARPKMVDDSCRFILTYQLELKCRDVEF